MSALAAQVARLRQELARNVRLRVGVAVIGAILALYAVLVLRDWRAELHERYVERREYLRKVRGLAGQRVWQARAQEMAAARKALEAAVPSAASPGLAQAMAQGWIREQVAPFGAAVQVQSRPVERVDGEPGIVRIPTVVSGSLNPRSVVNLLQQIERRSALTVVEEALIRNRENRTFQLTVVSYVRVEATDAVE